MVVREEAAAALATKGRRRLEVVAIKSVRQRIAYLVPLGERRIRCNKLEGTRSK